MSNCMTCGGRNGPGAINGDDEPTCSCPPSRRAAPAWFTRIDATVGPISTEDAHALADWLEGIQHRLSSPLQRQAAMAFVRQLHGAVDLLPAPRQVNGGFAVPLPGHEPISEP